MLTDEQADRAYQKALVALNATIHSGEGVTEEQKALAKQKREDLILNFIGRAIARIEERTAKFQEFIDEMEAVIAEFDPSTTIAGILRLKEVVDEAAQLVQIAVQPAAASAVALPEPAAASEAPARSKVRAFAPKAGRPAAKPARRGPKGKRPAAAKASKPAAGGAVVAKSASTARTPAKPAAKKPVAKARPVASKASGKKATAARPTPKRPAPKKPAPKKPAAKKPRTKKLTAGKGASTRTTKRRA